MTDESLFSTNEVESFCVLFVWSITLYDLQSIFPWEILYFYELFYLLFCVLYIGSHLHIRHIINTILWILLCFIYRFAPTYTAHYQYTILCFIRTHIHGTLYSFCFIYRFAPTYTAHYQYTILCFTYIGSHLHTWHIILPFVLCIDSHLHIRHIINISFCVLYI